MMRYGLFRVWCTFFSTSLQYHTHLSPSRLLTAASLLIERSIAARLFNDCLPPVEPGWAELTLLDESKSMAWRYFSAED